MKKINVGIIGAGRIAEVHAKSICYNIPEAKIIGIADPYLNEKSKKWIDELGITGVFTDPDKLINDETIDAILICSSTDTHAMYSQKCAKKGKHIFCEKPVDMDVDRIKETLAVVKEAGVKFQVGFNRRFDHNFMAIKNAVTEGKIGNPQIVKITSRDPQAPPIEYVKVSGGIFMDMTIHDFDMARYLSGSEAVEVFATGGALINEEIAKAGDIDTAIITLKMANGAFCIIDNSREAAYGYDQRAEVFGSKGSVLVNNDTDNLAILSTETGVSSEKPLFFFLERYMKAFTFEMKCFFKAIKEDSEVPVGGVDGLNSVLIAKAAKESLLSNRPVKIEY